METALSPLRSFFRRTRARSLLGFLTVVALAPTLSFARKTSFVEDHKGPLFGAGTYLTMPARIDPIPGMTRSGSTVASTKSFYLLPLKFGFYKTKNALSFEGYLRYVINVKGDWTSTGTDVGTGSTKYTSMGLGMQMGYAFAQRSRVQMQLVGTLEYVGQKLRLDFSDRSALSLSSTSYIMGGGLQMDVWLGDLWSLSLFGGYHYSPASTWNVAEAATFMGRAYAAGVLKDRNSEAMESQFGGTVVEATLKLGFY